MIPTLTKLSAFSNKRYMSPKQFEEWKKTPYGKYSTQLKKHPFLLFGLPFMASLFFASLYLSEFTSIRYKNRDERVQMITEEEALKSSSANRRKVDMREEFYVSKIAILIRPEILTQMCLETAATGRFG